MIKRIKMTDKKFKLVILVAIGIVAFLAIQDITGFHLWETVGGFSSETYQKTSSLYLKQFWTFAIVIMLLVALVYYIVRRDKSEALAIFLAPFTLILFGAEDVIYYIFMRLPIDATLPWLNGNPIIFAITSIMGNDVVTKEALLVSFVIGIILTYVIIKKLKKVRG